MTSRNRRTPPSEPVLGSFTDTLARVLGLARNADESAASRAAFRSELERLPAQSKARLSALLNIGRAAHDLARLPATPPSQGAPALDALALCDAHTLSRQYLERGLAAACAGKLPLDASVASAHRDTERSVYERAWSRFGKELAGSEPDEWTWFACCKGRSSTLDELFVQHGKGAWWSFGAGLDRPLRGQLEDARKRAKSARPNSQGSSLDSLLNREGSPSRRALRRALASVHARLGKINRDAAPAASL